MKFWKNCSNADSRVNFRGPTPLLVSQKVVQNENKNFPRACLLEANAAERSHFFLYEFAICSWYQNVKENWGNIFCDLGLFTNSLFAKRMPLQGETSDPKMYLTAQFVTIWQCGIPFESTEVVYRRGSDSPLHLNIRNTYQMHMGKQFSGARRLLPVDMLERWPHVCRMMTFTLLPTNCFVSTIVVVALSWHKRSKKQHFKIDCVSTIRTSYDTYKHVT